MNKIHRALRLGCLMASVWPAGVWACVESANLTLETPSPSKTADEIQDMARASGAVVQSMNSYKNQPFGRTQGYLNLRLTPEKIPGLMAEIGKKGKVVNQNYNSQKMNGALDPRDQLAALDKEIEALGSHLSKAPTIAAAAYQQRQNLSQQVNALDNDVPACLNITLQEPGASQQSRFSGLVLLIWAIPILVGLLLIGGLGALLYWALVRRRPQTL